MPQCVCVCLSRRICVEEGLCVCVHVLDSPRPGAADHLEVRGRLEKEKKKGRKVGQYITTQ